MSVPFFDKFDEKTKDFFKQDKYDLGQTVEVVTSCCPDLKIKSKFSSVGSNDAKSKFVFTVKKDFGSIEITEDLKKGLSVEVKLPKFYRGIDVVSEHSNKDVKVTTKYNPENSYWNTKLIGYFNPCDKENNRVCKATGSFAVGEESLKLNVGGSVVIENKANINDTQPLNVSMPTYAIGFLYCPTEDTQFSSIYTPEKKGYGLKYALSCYRKMSPEVTLSAKAEGAVDTKLSAFAPNISFGAGYNIGSNYFQGFVNSKKEWGFAYKVKVNDAATVNLGVASFIGPNGGVSSKFGYKLSV